MSIMFMVLIGLEIHQSRPPSTKALNLAGHAFVTPSSGSSFHAGPPQRPGIASGAPAKSIFSSFVWGTVAVAGKVVELRIVFGGSVE